MTTFNEFMDELDGWRDRLKSCKRPGDANPIDFLKKFITTQRARIVELEGMAKHEALILTTWKDEVGELEKCLKLYANECESCHGTGSSKPLDSSDKYHGECPACNGAGRHRRWVVPGWFVELLDDRILWVDHDASEIYINEGEPLGVIKNRKVIATLTNLPTGEGWEITQRT